MQQTMKEKIQAKLQNSEGFTLLEILVVLTIMGFLIAMVAPRLAGISGDAVDTVCDTNQNRMISMMSGYYEKTNRYPDKLTNIVEETAAGVYQIPAISDDDPDNGAETIASEFNDRNHFRIHYLTSDEVLELKGMGIVNVYNLNAYDAYNDDGTAIKGDYDETAATGPNEVDLAATATKAPAMEEFTLDTDVATNPIAVMMVGAGHDGTNWDISTDERGWGEADFMSRIVFGFGPESGLVTSGIVSNAAHCPGGIQNADNVTYNDYNLVLPRLEATVDETNTGYETDLAALDADSDDTSIQVAAVGYDDAPTAAYDYVGNADNYKTRIYDLGAQEKWQYATMCPEGHKFPADDGEFWGIDLNPTAGPGGPTAGALD
ncbi:prepilin-type N-terminal cleavage/methylation domain-containing protein [Desulfobulbus rhabdoformis]|uniref:type II secretion system protein n=1 Tax=Desulfobulbus rhabdoformis TaxID=34032 RepID=UPI0019655369|nr:prepilin-type N-terminal cleavage/methylation domain-containing protein [Desulfobulbus rhabdoformis]MBM9612859.1 prepilin-type N-terminal cleavage/methylation domain-containing protein [Desulfobulbus rhabdoformis]